MQNKKGPEAAEVFRVFSKLKEKQEREKKQCFREPSEIQNK